MLGRVNGGSSGSLTYSQAALLFIFRQQTGVNVGYAFDEWGYKSVIGGSENADITVTVSSNHTVAISNAKTNAIEYIAIIM